MNFSRFTRKSCHRIGLLAIAALSAGTLHAQRSQTAEDPSERFRRMSREAEAKGLAEPFKGVTTDGKVCPGFSALSPPVSRPRRCERRRVSCDAQRGAAGEDELSRGRSGMAEVDEPAFLCAPGRELSGDVGGAARRGFRPDARRSARRG